jgi:hypothetical protein
VFFLTKYLSCLSSARSPQVIKSGCVNCSLHHGHGADCTATRLELLARGAWHANTPNHGTPSHVVVGVQVYLHPRGEGDRCRRAKERLSGREGAQDGRGGTMVLDKSRGLP